MVFYISQNILNIILLNLTEVFNQIKSDQFKQSQLYLGQINRYSFHSSIIFKKPQYSMTENIKIYRNSNPKLGFLYNECTVNNLYVDERSLRNLVEYINKQFLICSNKQTAYLLQGTIDLSNTYITILCIMIAIPIIKSVLFDNYEYIAAEYFFIFTGMMVYLWREFNRSSQMKRQYFQAEEQLEQSFMEIQSQFNSRFDYLKMEYTKAYSQQQQDYLQIKVTKVPQDIKRLEDRFKNKINLIPIQS